MSPRQNPLQLQRNLKFSTSLLVLRSKRTPRIMSARVLCLHLFLLQNLLLSTVRHLVSSPSRVQVSRRIQRTMLEKVLSLRSFPRQNLLLFNLSSRHYSDLQVQLQTSMSGIISLVLVHSLPSVELHTTKELRLIITKTLLLMSDMRIMVSSLKEVQTNQFLTLLTTQLVFMLMSRSPNLVDLLIEKTLVISLLTQSNLLTLMVTTMMIMDLLIPPIDSHLVDLPSTMAVLPRQLPSSRSNFLWKDLYSNFVVLEKFMYSQYILVLVSQDLVEMQLSESEQSTMVLVLHSPSSVVQKLLVLFHQQKHHFSTSMVLQKRDLERATTMPLVHSLHSLVLRNLQLSAANHKFSSMLTVLLLRSIPKIMLELVLSLDSFLLQKQLSSTVQHQDYSSSKVEQSRRTPRTMLVLVLCLHSTVLQKQQKFSALHLDSSSSLVLQPMFRSDSINLALVHSLDSMVEQSLSHSTIAAMVRLLILGQTIMDSLLILLLTRQLLIMQMSRLALMRMR